MKATVYIAALTAVFIGMSIWVSVTGAGLSAELANILDAAKAPGVKMVLADLYIGFLILAGWIVYRDGASFKALILIISMLCLGNIVPLLYILWLLIRSRGDVWEVLLGRKA